MTGLKLPLPTALTLHRYGTRRRWIDENGKAMLEVLYDNKRLEIKPKTLDYGIA
jgi:hypothetical protein